MARFKDQQGHEWDLVVDIGTAARVRRATNKRIDLVNPLHEVEGKPLNELLADDLIEFWEVLFYLVEPQAKEFGLDAEGFAKRLGDQSIVLAREAFFTEWADFFRRCQQQKTADGLALLANAKQRVRQELEAAIDPATMTKVQAKIESQIRKACGEVSTNLRASLDAILAD